MVCDPDLLLARSPFGIDQRYTTIALFIDVQIDRSENVLVLVYDEVHHERYRLSIVKRINRSG